jgi:hypothetical protein
VQRTHHAVDPVVQALGRVRASENAAGPAHVRDEYLRTGAVTQWHGGGSEVEEQLLAGAPVLTHGALEGAGERLVAFAKLRASPLGLCADNNFAILRITPLP